MLLLKMCIVAIFAKNVLMGLKSLDSTVGTKPATEALLDSAAFKMEWFSRSCDPTSLLMGFTFYCEGSPSVGTLSFYIFS